MAVIRIYKDFHFEMAHVLYQHDGACKNIHGHSYQLRVCVKGEPMKQPGHPKDGMVMDFGVLKNIVNELIVSQYDHSLVVNQAVGEKWIASLQDLSTRLIVHDFQPTSENLIAYFADLLNRFLPDEVTLYALRLHETPTAFVEWYAQDQEGIQGIDEPGF